MKIEELSMGDALLIALSGIATVTIMLGCLAILIVIISKVVASFDTKKTTTTQSAPVAQPQAQVKDPNATYGGETLLIDVDEKTAACIMAIVSDETGIDLSELVFKKIRAL